MAERHSVVASVGSWLTSRTVRLRFVARSAISRSSRVFVIKSKTHHDTLGGESLKMLSEYAGSNGMELIVLTMPTGAGFEIFEEKGGRGSGNLRA